MQTIKTTTDVLGQLNGSPLRDEHSCLQFDALGVLSQDTGAVDAWGKHFPTIHGSISRWWIQNGRPVVTDVASARDISKLSELAFQYETWAPRLA